MVHQALVTVLMALAAGIAPTMAAPLEDTTVVGAPTNVTEADGGIQIQAATEHYGRGTVYLQGGVAGSCGTVHKDGDLIVALGHKYMQHQYKNSHCGKRVRVTNTGSTDGNVKGKGRDIVARVADSCDGCPDDAIDLSVGGWNSITQNSAYSQFSAKWHFMD